MDIKEKILLAKNIKYNDKLKILALYDYLSDSKKEQIENIINNGDIYNTIIEDINILFLDFKKKLIKKIERDSID